MLQSKATFHLEYNYVCLFVLRFYGPINPMGSCRARSVYLTTFYWTGLVLQAVKQYCAHSFARNWQLGENGHRKYFKINFHKECCRSGWGGTRNLLITSRTRIQLSHLGRRDNYDAVCFTAYQAHSERGLL